MHIQLYSINTTKIPSSNDDMFHYFIQMQLFENRKEIINISMNERKLRQSFYKWCLSIFLTIEKTNHIL